MNIIKNTSILLFSEIIAKGIAFLLIPLYSYVIEPEDFGKIAILQLIFTGFYLIVSFSLKSTFDKYFFDNNNKPLAFLFSNLAVLQLTAIIIACVLYIFSRNTLVDLIDLNNSFYLDLVFLTSIFSVFFPLVNSYLICVAKIGKVGIYTIIISIVRSIIALVLVLKMEDKVMAILCANFLEHFLGLLISLPYYINNIKIKSVELNGLKELSAYSVIYFPTMFSNYIIKFADRFMIQYLLGYQSLGIYSMGTRLVNVPGQFISTINKNFTPQMYQGLRDKNRIQVNKLIRFFLIVLFILTFTLIIFSQEIFYVIGEDYKTAFTIFIILCFSSYANGYNLLIQPVMTYYKKYVKYKSIIFVTVGILNILANFIVIPIYGINGAALATTSSYLISIPFNYYYSKKAFAGDYFLKWFFSSCVVISICSGYMIFNTFGFSIPELILRMAFFMLILYLFIRPLGNIKELVAKSKVFLSTRFSKKNKH